MAHRDGLCDGPKPSGWFQWSTDRHFLLPARWSPGQNIARRRFFRAFKADTCLTIQRQGRLNAGWLNPAIAPKSLKPFIEPGPTNPQRYTTPAAPAIEFFQPFRQRCHVRQSQTVYPSYLAATHSNKWLIQPHHGWQRSHPRPNASCIPFKKNRAKRLG